MGAKQCDVHGCKEPAKYNFRNLRPTKCLLHMLVGMVWTFSTKCKCDKKAPSFGYKDDLWPSCCRVCKADDMIFTRVVPKCECGESSCPMFALPGEKYKYCKKCPDYDPETMIDTRSRRCKCGKSTKPAFGVPTDKKASYCKECQEYDESTMICFLSTACKCKKHTALYGYPADAKALYCSRCPEYNKETMVDLSHAKCACGKFRPSFNFPSQETPMYCSQCPDYNPDTMVDVANRMCVTCGKHRPVFNVPGAKRADYCMACSTPDMIDVISRRCQCGAHGPCFNYPDEDTALYCTECPGYDPDKMVDIVNRMCVTCKSRRPTFNVPGAKRADYCKACSTPDMVDVVLRRRCRCGAHAPCFNYPDKEVPEFCTQCPGFDKHMVDLANKNKQCQSPSGCTTRAHFEFEGKMYCHDHYNILDPDYNNKRVFIRKEHLVLCELERLCTTVLGATKSKWDEGIGAGPDVTTCKGKRPDMLYYFPDYILIVEVDEFAHQQRGYCVSGEKQKMNEIFEQLSPHNLPVGWIRFNPDSYTDTVTGEKHPSIFERYKPFPNGGDAIRASSRGAFVERMQALADLATQMIEQKTEGVRFLNYGEFEYDPAALDDIPEGLDDLAI